MSKGELIAELEKIEGNPQVIMSGRPVLSNIRLVQQQHGWWQAEDEQVVVIYADET